MHRRTVLKAMGASTLAGLAASGAVSATDGDPRLVDFEKGVAVDFLQDVGDEGYRVEYEDDSTVVVIGGIVYSRDCSWEVHFRGFEETDFGDVAVIEFTGNPDDICPDVVTEVTYCATITYPQTADDLFTKHIGYTDTE